MEKVIRDGKVAIIYSPGYGAGWYTWNSEFPFLIFHPELVNAIENRKPAETIIAIAKQLIQESVTVRYNGEDEDEDDDSYFYGGGVDELTITWLPVGTKFRILEYDGSEGVEILDPKNFMEA